jgi:hypothetical protein
VELKDASVTALNDLVKGATSRKAKKATADATAAAAAHRPVTGLLALALQRSTLAVERRVESLAGASRKQRPLGGGQRNKGSGGSGGGRSLSLETKGEPEESKGGARGNAKTGSVGFVEHPTMLRKQISVSVDDFYADMEVEDILKAVATTREKRQANGGGAGAGNADDTGAKVVTVHVLRATNLRNADGMLGLGMLGKSDPFVELTWRGAVVLKTHTVQNHLSPTWDNESCALPAWTAAYVRRKEERDRLY